MATKRYIIDPNIYNDIRPLNRNPGEPDETYYERRFLDQINARMARIAQERKRRGQELTNLLQNLTRRLQKDDTMVVGGIQYMLGEEYKIRTNKGKKTIVLRKKDEWLQERPHPEGRRYRRGERKEFTVKPNPTPLLNRHINDLNIQTYRPRYDMNVTRTTNSHDISENIVVTPVNFFMDVDKFNELPLIWETVKQKVIPILAPRLNTHSLRITMDINALLQKNDGTLVDYPSHSDRRELPITNNREGENADDDSLNRGLDNRFHYIMDRFEEHTQNGSDWTIRELYNFTFYVSRISRRAHKWLPLPEVIANKKAVINIQNKCDQCFLFNIALHEQFVKNGNKAPDNAHRPSHYTERVKQLKEELRDIYNTDEGLDLYRHHLVIPKIEDRLKLRIPILTYYKIGDKYEYKLNRASKRQYDDVMVLLYIPTASELNEIEKDIESSYHDPEEEEDMDNNNEEELSEVKFTGHVAYVTNINALMCSSIASDKHKRFWCGWCFKQWRSKTQYEEHIQRNGACITEVPKTELVFPTPDNAYVKQPRVEKYIEKDFVIYCDFEAFTNEKTNNEHEVNSAGFFTHCLTNPDFTDKQVTILKLEGGESQQQFFCRFWDQLWSIWYACAAKMQRFKQIGKMKITPEQEQQHKEAKTCHLCKCEFGEGEDFPGLEHIMLSKENQNIKVRHHNHCNGLYQFAACRKCNLKIRLDYKICVIFHNASGYDVKFILRHLTDTAKLSDDDKQPRISILSQSSEKTISVTISKFVFLDSLRFIPASLDALVSKLTLDKFESTKRVFGDKWQLFCRKGIYPYSWVESITQMEETKALPPIEAFYNKLREERCSYDDYEYAKTVWNETDCNTFFDYHKKYLIADIVLLADVFTNFRRDIIKLSGLDPVGYHTLPSLSWDISVMKSDYNIELFNNEQADMYNWLLATGGFCCLVKRHSVANNKYLQNYNPKLPPIYIIVVDINSLYPYVLTKRQPQGDFRWENPPFFFQQDKDGYCTALEQYILDFLGEEASRGYFFEIDYHYPPELHKKHADLPFFAKKTVIQEEDLSPYAKKTKEELGINKLDKTQKLVCDLRDGQNLKIHHDYLRLGLEQGLRITKCHKVLSFRQEPIFEKYMREMYQKRVESQDETFRDTVKLSMNAVSGKTLTREADFTKITLTNRGSIHQLRVDSDYGCARVKEFLNNDYVLIESFNAKNNITKPRAIGASLMDMSKTVVYDYYYNFLKPKYDDKVRLLYTDTDSFYFEVETEDYFKDMAEDRNFDKYHSQTELGKMKHEVMLPYQITEFIGLRSKMYSYKVEKIITPIEQIPAMIKEKFYSSKKPKSLICSKAKGISLRGAIFVNRDGDRVELNEGDDTRDIVTIKHHQYRQALYNKLPDLYIKQQSFKSKNMKITNHTTCKKGFNCFDTKRWICDDGIHTLPYGYKGPPL